MVDDPRRALKPPHGDYDQLLKKFLERLVTQNCAYFGPDEDGSWRIIPDGTDLVVQLKELGVWVSKHTFTP